VPLRGEVEIGGAKNASLAIVAAAILTDEKVRIDNLPDVRDVNVLLTSIEEIGARVEKKGKHSVVIDGSGVHSLRIDYENIKKIRASYYLLGA
jgi:UDP-N-acetylglucosamine 1-carboxyvinyltransferase